MVKPQPVYEDSALVAMDEGALIPVKKTGGEELSVVSVSSGNIVHDTIIVEEQDARFELDGKRAQVEMPPSPATGGSLQPIMMIEDSSYEQIANVGGPTQPTQPVVVDESDYEQTDEAPAYIRDIVRRDVSDEDMESEYTTTTAIPVLLGNFHAHLDFRGD